jgi:F420-non-reducing hydrogenase iron-sulfur subunit
MKNRQLHTLAFFYCQNVPGSSEPDRQALEKRYGSCIRLFPVPCSGRVEPIHLLRALEEFADIVYVITCPEGGCRYFEGNRRAKKRLERAKAIIASIGLEAERLGIVVSSEKAPKELSKAVEEVYELTSHIKPSPVLRKSAA